MVRRSILALVVAACHASAPTDVHAPGDGTVAAPSRARPRLERDGDAGVDLVYQGRAIAALAVPGRVVVLEPDFVHLHGVEPGSGEIVWRRRLPATPEGEHTLLADDYRVLVHGGPHLAIVDARDGRILGRNDDVPPNETHDLVVRDGGCAVIGACTIAVVDCAEAARIGSVLGDAKRSCVAVPRVLGRAGELTIVTVPRDETSDLVAIPASGRRRWSVPMTAAPDFRAGVTAGLDAIWTVDDARVLVRRASTGEERWRAPLGLRVQRVSLHGGLLVVVGRSGQRVTAVAFELDTGHERWRRRFAARRSVLLEGDDPGPIATGGYRTVEVLAEQTGASVGRFVAAPDETLWADVDGGYVRTDGDIEELGPDGTLLRQQPFTGGDVLAIGATHLVSRAGADLLFHDRIALRERARLVRDFTVDPTSPRLGPHRVLLRRPDDAGVLVLVVGLEPTSRARRRAE